MYDAESTSASPSPSRWAAKTDHAPLAVVVMTCWGPKLPPPSEFSYQATLPSTYDADSTSRSASPSRSAASTALGSWVADVTTCWDPNSPRPSTFSYQETWSSMVDAERTSWSPSPSRSAGDAALPAPLPPVAMTCRVPKTPSPSTFSYQVSAPFPDGALRTSRSPSPSRSTATTDSAPSTPVVTADGAPKLPRPSVFSYQATPADEGEAESTSGSPSPSRSAAKTARAETAAFVMTCRGPKVPRPSPFSYQAIV